MVSNKEARLLIVDAIINTEDKGIIEMLNRLLDKVNERSEDNASINSNTGNGNTRNYAN